MCVIPFSIVLEDVSVGFVSDQNIDNLFLRNHLLMLCESNGGDGSSVGVGMVLSN